MATYETRTRRWTRIEYEKLVDLGIFQPGEPIELIGGELMVAEPQGAAHYTAIRKTVRTLEAAFGPGWEVRNQGPIGLDEESEPEPDVAVVPGRPEDYRSAHPSRPVLTVEVAESSLGSDRERKGSVYARAASWTTGSSTWSTKSSRCTASRPPIRRRPSAGVTRGARSSTSRRR